jgi:lysyl-tRNA synthetase class 2
MVQAPSPEAQFSLMQVHGESRENENLPQKPNAFLITSPEYQMKRMLVGGFEKIFQICRCFRNGEIGPLHHPEFTMLEWYRAHGTLRDVINDVTQLCRYLSTKVSGTVPINDQSWPILRVRDLFQDKLGIRLTGRESSQELLAQAQDSGMSTAVEDLTESNPDELSYESVFFRLWDQIEPELGKECPVWVWEWPLPLASLARPLPDSPGFADRAECYVNGIELANGFGELTDPEEQLRRFQSDLELREKTSRQHVPLDHKFLQSLKEGMPHSAGMALGLDRLLLWLTGTKNISQVLTFSWEEI